MKEYPLFFTLNHEIPCQDYVARIVSRGRVLMALEDGEWWCHGVAPGGITERGETPVVAWTAFKAAMGGVFADLSKRANTYEAFEESVHAFIDDGDATEAERWDAARQAVRASSSAAEDMPFKGLTRIVEDLKPGATIMRLETIVPPEQEMVALAEAA